MTTPFASQLRAKFVGALTGSGRASRAMRTGFVALASRSLSILGTLITIPLVLHHLGPERYGVWMTISVIFVYLKLADGGATIGLIALVSQADGIGDTKRIRALFSSALALTLVVTLVLIAISLLAPLLDWGNVLKLQDPSLAHEAGAAAALIMLAVGLGYPSGFTRQGRLGLQQGAAANTWDLAATSASFIGQLAVVYLNLGLVSLAAVTAFTPVVVNFLSSVVFYADKGRALKPRLSLASWPAMRSLFASGSMFMALTLTQALSIQIEPVLIARTIGVEAVAHYTVVQKLFVQPQLFITMFLVAQFPAYGEALTRGDDRWIIKHFRQTLMIVALIAAAACLALAIVAKPLLALWIGKSIEPSPKLIVALAFYGTAAAVANAFTYFYFALGRYRPVILSYAAMIVLDIPLALFLIPRIGPAGMAIATSCGYALAMIIPSLISVRSVLNGLPQLREKALKSSTASGSEATA